MKKLIIVTLFIISKAEIIPPAEKEKVELPQTEPIKVIPEEKPVPEEVPTIAEAQLTPAPVSAPTPVPTPASSRTVIGPYPGDMVYVPGFGWLECQGEGTVIYDDMMYENGNKVGSMD